MRPAFGKADLERLLPDNIIRPSSKGSATSSGPLKPKIDLSKRVVRYFPNKAPKWASSSGQSADSAEVEPVRDSRLERISHAEARPSSAKRRRVHEAEIVGEVAPKPRRYVEAAIIEEDAEEKEDVRETLRKRLLLEEQEEQTGVIEELEEEEEESESESSEQEMLVGNYVGPTRTKPVFKQKDERVTIIEKEMKEREKEAAKKKEEEKKRQREIESRAMVAAELQKKDSEEEDEGGDDLHDLPSTDEEEEDSAQYEAWKLRELKRLKRDKEKRDALETEKRATERRRNMTDSERRADDVRLAAEGKKVLFKEKVHWNFLQKYYHKGAFFMDDDSVNVEKDDVRKRAVDDPTLDDKFDRTKLPKVMQVKKFGLKGRTKYTHLTDEDTTNKESPWIQNDGLRLKYQSRMSAMNAPLEIRRKSRKRKAPG